MARRGRAVSMPHRPSTWRSIILGLGALLALAAASADRVLAADGGLLSAREIAALVTHGPWPPPARFDPSNRVSGKPEAIELGRLLFFDAKLSPSGRISCSSCHRPERGWTDGRPVGIGLARGRRNTPSLLDVGWRRWLGWDGAQDSLWAQSLRPLLDPAEMGSSAQHVQVLISSSSELAGLYEALFGRPAAAVDPEEALVDAAKALAAYQEMLTSPRAPFDDLRDTLAAGGVAATRTGYPVAALRGARLFVGSAKCATCHTGPSFSDGSFRRLGKRRAGLGDRYADRGRAGGLERLRKSPYALDARFNDDSSRSTAATRAELATRPEDDGAFRVPTLRALAATAPYLHDGSASTLAEAIRRHGLPGLRAQDIADLTAFLETLSVPASRSPRTGR